MKLLQTKRALQLLLSTVVMASISFSAEVPQPGQAAPEFSLPSQEGAPVSLKQFRGKWVVLYFYPKDMTQGCTIEAHNFQQDQDQYTAKKAAIVGVSADNVDS